MPLTLHARYTRREVIAAAGHASGVKHKVTQGGVLWMPEIEADAFFVDLRKAERDYSPDDDVPRLRDQQDALSLGVAEPPDTAAADGAALHPPSRARDASLAVRARAQAVRARNGSPFYFLGPVSYVEHRGERPVSFTWQLPRPMPESLFEIARSVAAA